MLKQESTWDEASKPKARATLNPNAQPYPNAPKPNPVWPHPRLNYRALARTLKP